MHLWSPFSMHPVGQGRSHEGSSPRSTYIVTLRGRDKLCSVRNIESQVAALQYNRT